MKIEFFNGDDGKVWFRSDEGCFAFSPNNIEIIQYIVENIERVFPATFARLSELFSLSKRNRQFFHYRIAERFIRCNMGDDNCRQMDIDDGRFNLERVSCPLRGLCKDEGVVCCPRACSSMSGEEQKVAMLYMEGYTIKETATILGKSFSTVNNQLWNITKKLGLHSRREVISVCRNLNMQ